jgi:hypothetical protein
MFSAIVRSLRAANSGGERQESSIFCRQGRSPPGGPTADGSLRWRDGRAAIQCNYHGLRQRG